MKSSDIYSCPHCYAPYANRQDAINCCAHPAITIVGYICSVCNTAYMNMEAAIKCCKKANYDE